MTEARLTAYGALLLRLVLGAFTLSHGLIKVFVFTVPGTVAFFDSIGLPAPIAYLTMIGEVGGGLALLLGLHTRLISLLLVPLLLGATWAHSGNGFLFSGAGGGYEYPLFWTLALLAQALLGPGLAALPSPVAKYVKLPA
jgi:putative oxidoreductase